MSGSRSSIVYSMSASAGTKTGSNGSPSSGVTVTAYCVMALWRSPGSAGGASSQLRLMESLVTLTIDAAGNSV